MIATRSPSVLDVVALLHRFRMPEDLKSRWRRGLFRTRRDPDATARSVDTASSKTPCYRPNSLTTTVVSSARIFEDRVDSATSLKTA
jgi:hypothetical protein